VPIEKWATIACDQFTSNPEYWEEAEKLVGDSPSSLKLQMPEAWLRMEDRKQHREDIPLKMKEYLSSGVLKELGEGFMFIKRTLSNGKIRRGLLVNLSLDDYEYAPGNKALCRATEGTVESRLPARIEIRKAASLEMPHIMVVVNDTKDILMGRMEILTRNREPLYDAELMLGSGHIKGWFISKEEDIALVYDSIELLKAEAAENDNMLYAVGDGNHSLAAAKRCGDKYAMVELVNLYDDAMEFHPIHRLVNEKGEVVDYIHGEEETKALAEKLGLKADIRPDYPKSRLFKDVIEKGVLEKKTFSIGEGVDKRFYLECQIRR